MPNGLGAIFDRGLNTAFERRWGIRDDVGFSMMPEVAAVVPLDSPEMAFHLGWRRYMAGGSITALAANFARVLIRMPRLANIICVIEGLWLGSANAEIVVAGTIATSDLTTVFGAEARDTLQTATKPGSCIVSAQPGGALPVAGGVYSIQALTMAPIFPLILRPSLVPNASLDGYTFASTTANQAYDFCITYRERMLNDQENST